MIGRVTGVVHGRNIFDPKAGLRIRSRPPRMPPRVSCAGSAAR
jgi:hypothetical protein